ncbi:hypothetical protein Rsub_04532 [Raphidocelis subcapitata]|uniref:Uncharacterized protein n=1 Tax=Raphidocelis subcapitata TaxID=307507 RepID=A0A2V0NXR5_9CHLO|nr:hypothetical protein Rsub_04532 [Raphidocelis subcapitata]|eukprot:GBF92428.1 hypothetical protein Rsub_04532 [Raphidocelis subcapitata]
MQHGTRPAQHAGPGSCAAAAQRPPLPLCPPRAGRRCGGQQRPRLSAVADGERPPAPAGAPPAAAAAAAAAAPPPPRRVEEGPLVSPRKEAQLTAEQYREIYDRLIAIFQQRPRDDWKKLIVLSRQWPQHKAGVFDRLRERADKEGDLDAKMVLRRVFRTLQGVDGEVDGEVTRYNTALAKFLGAEEAEWEAVVAAYRGDLQRPFFEHMQCLIAAAKDDEGGGAFH